jgi:DNA-binding MarR family transcriptional regulator
MLLLEKEQTGRKLDTLNVQILSCLKAKAQTERQLSKKVNLDTLALSPLVTDLMLMGYVETFRRRRLYFFSREYLSITAEGLAALQKAKSPLQNIIDLIRDRALETVEEIAAASPIVKILVIFARLW